MPPTLDLLKDRKQSREIGSIIRHLDGYPLTSGRRPLRRSKMFYEKAVWWLNRWSNVTTYYPQKLVVAAKALYIVIH